MISSLRTRLEVRLGVLSRFDDEGFTGSDEDPLLYLAERGVLDQINSLDFRSLQERFEILKTIFSLDCAFNLSTSCFSGLDHVVRCYCQQLQDDAESEICQAFREMAEALLGLLNVTNFEKKTWAQTSLREIVERSMSKLFGNVPSQSNVPEWDWKNLEYQNHDSAYHADTLPHNHSIEDEEIHDMNQVPNDIKLRSEKIQQRAAEMNLEREKARLETEAPKEKTASAAQKIDEAELRTEVIKERTASTSQEIEEAKLKAEIMKEKTASKIDTTEGLKQEFWKTKLETAKLAFEKEKKILTKGAKVNDEAQKPKTNLTAFQADVMSAIARKELLATYNNTEIDIDQLMKQHLGDPDLSSLGQNLSHADKQLVATIAQLRFTKNKLEKEVAKEKGLFKNIIARHEQGERHASGHPTAKGEPSATPTGWETGYDGRTDLADSESAHSNDRADSWDNATWTPKSSKDEHGSSWADGKGAWNPLY